MTPAFDPLAIFFVNDCSWVRMGWDASAADVTEVVVRNGSVTRRLLAGQNGASARAYPRVSSYGPERSGRLSLPPPSPYRRRSGGRVVRPGSRAFRAHRRP